MTTIAQLATSRRRSGGYRPSDRRGSRAGVECGAASMIGAAAEDEL